MPTLLDHLYVVLVLGLIFPIGGWWAYRRFLARLETQGEGALVREYQYTLLWLLGLGAGALLVWFEAGRGWPSIGFGPTDYGASDGFIVGATIGAFGALALRPLLALFVPRFADAMRSAYAPLAPFLPKTGTQLFWGLFVSVAAGVAEEIAYRGMLMAYLVTWFSNWGALAISSLLFGAAHLYQGWKGVLTTTLLGAALGYIYIKTDSLTLPILLHIAINVSSMLTAWIVLRRRSATRAVPAG